MENGVPNRPEPERFHSQASTIRWVDHECPDDRGRTDVRRLAAPVRFVSNSPLVHSLRFRLTLLVLLASLPSLGLLLVTASQQRDDALEAGRDEARRLVELIAADQRGLSRNIELGLTALASLPELRGSDTSACTQFLQNLPSSGSEPGGSTAASDYQIDNATYRQVAVVNRDRTIFCRGGSSVTTISPEDAAVLQATFENERLSFGNYRADPTTGGLLITYGYPVTRNDGQGIRVILASLEVTALSTFARRAQLPPGAFVTIFDNEGILQQRYPPNDDPVGASIEGTPIVDQTIGITSGQDVPPEEQEIDGESYIHETQELFLVGSIDGIARTHVVVALPEEGIVRRANDKFNENLGKLGIVALVAMVAAWIGADLFVSRDAEARKSVIRNLYSVFSTGDTDDLEEIIGPGYVDRTLSPGQAPGIEGLKQSIGAFRAAFPDGEITARELLADGDKVVARVTLTGTHVADYFGTPPSGTPIASEGVEIFRFAHGMVVESWSLFGEIRPLRIADKQPAMAPERPPGLLGRIFGRRNRRVQEGPEHV